MIIQRYLYVWAKSNTHPVCRTIRVDICLIPDQYAINVFSCILVDLSHPITHIDETVFIRHIVNKKNSHCASIVSGSYSPKSFLTSSIPDLQFNFWFLDQNGFDLEVNSNSCYEWWCEWIIRISQEQARFANACSRYNQKYSENEVWAVNKSAFTMSDSCCIDSPLSPISSSLMR